jgi:cytochrome b561
MLRNRDNAYGLITILFHWTIAALFVGQILLGLTTQWVASMALQFTLIQWHKSFGFLILALAALRLLWALANRRPARPRDFSRAEWLAAKLVQSSLYVLVLAVPLTGWALVSTSTLQIPSFAFNLFVIPHLPLARSEATEHFWREIHQWLAYGTAAVAAGHMLAALRHHFWLGDGILKRMLQPGAESPSRGTVKGQKAAGR